MGKVISRVGASVACSLTRCASAADSTGRCGAEGSVRSPLLHGRMGSNVQGQVRTQQGQVMTDAGNADNLALGVRDMQKGTTGRCLPKMVDKTAAAWRQAAECMAKKGPDGLQPRAAACVQSGQGALSC